MDAEILMNEQFSENTLNEKTTSGVCDAHRALKRGTCHYCGYCLKCLAPSTCMNRSNHQTKKPGRPRSICFEILGGGNSNDNDGTINAQSVAIESSGTSEGSASTPCSAQSTGDINFSASTGLRLVFEALGLNTNQLLCIPRGGIRNLKHNVGKMRRAKKIISDVLHAVCKLVIYDEAVQTRVMNDMVVSNVARSPSKNRVQEILLVLSMFGYREISTVWQDVLAKSL